MALSFEAERTRILGQAETIVDLILENARDRSGVGDMLESIDDETYQELRDTWILLTYGTLTGISFKKKSEENGQKDS